MDNEQYLTDLLKAKKVSDESTIAGELSVRRAEIEGILLAKFQDPRPKIRYGGSRVKGTMIRDAYDLDITCYFLAGGEETLEEIYNNVRDTLSTAGYVPEEKTSAIRVKKDGCDYHVDVVPGRFFDDTETDVWLHQTAGTKERLKTNLDVHIQHVKGSGAVNAICLLKLWREQYAITDAKTFVLELLAVKLLKGRTSGSLDAQLRYVLTEFRDNANNLTVEDPANAANDLSQILSGMRYSLQSAATQALEAEASGGWSSVFGMLLSETDRMTAIRSAASTGSTPSYKPWGQQ